MTDRYDTSGNPEDEYYPGTSVLINLEEIRDPEELLEGFNQDYAKMRAILTMCADAG